MSNPHPDPLADMLTMPHELDGKFEPQAKTVTTCISDVAELVDALDLGSDAYPYSTRRCEHFRPYCAAGVPFPLPPPLSPDWKMNGLETD